MSLITCPDCQKEISNAAPACPGCGWPNPNISKEDIPKKSVSVLLGLGIIFLPVIFSWYVLRKGYSTVDKVTAFVWLAVWVWTVIDFERRGMTLDFPRCDSAKAETIIADSIEESKIGKIDGLRLIKITDSKELSASEGERKCSGVARITDTKQYPITYEFYRDVEGDSMVRYQIEWDNPHPNPLP